MMTFLFDDSTEDATTNMQFVLVSGWPYTRSISTKCYLAIEQVSGLAPLSASWLG